MMRAHKEVAQQVRITTTLTKVAMVIAMIAIVLVGLGLPALALDGPTPPELADPGPGAIAPHGGYSSGTDFCLQCHSIHVAPDPGYALMAESSTTAVCATCHSYGGVPATGPADPDFPGVEGTASTRAVYTSSAVHVIGANGPATYTSDWDYGWSYGGPLGPGTTRTTAVLGTASATDGGLYCASCHTPHGEFGQLINSKWVVTTADQTGGPDAVDPAVLPWQDGTRIWWENPTTGVWEVRYLSYYASESAWLVCEPEVGGACDWAQVKDSEGQLVSLYGYKLLSSSTNHQYPFRSGSTFTETGTTTPPGTTLYSNAGAMIGDLVSSMTTTDLTFTVNETTGTLTARPSGYVQIGTEIIRITSVTGGTFPTAAAVYTVQVADVDGKTGRGWNNTTPAVHAAGDDVLTMGTNRAAVRSWKTDIYNHDGSLVCGTCHSSRIDWSWGGTNHNHPTGCEACHGNPSDGSSSDFPHSSTSSVLLQEVPDGLCINCHTQGSLP